MANGRTTALRLGLLAALAATCAVAAPAAGAAAGSCPNAAIRVQQHATALPACRAYEQVSPVQKGGVDVLGDTQRSFTAAAPSGDALAYSSSAAFGDAAGAAFPSIYRALRGADGWRTSAVSPPQDATVAGGLGGGNTSVVDAFTTDLGQAVVRTNHALTPGVPAGTPNLYVRDNAAGSYRLLTPGGPAVADFTNPYPEFAWATPDLSSVVFTSDDALTDDAPIGAVPKVYVAHGGTVELASVLPGDVPTGGLAGDPQGDGSQGTISADGRYVFFGVVPDDYSRPTGMYMRDLDAGTTTEIVPAGTAAWFAAASADGSRVLFQTKDPATNSETYVLYDVASGTSTMLEAADGSGVEAGTTLAVSDDLRSVYLVAYGTLLAGQDPVPSGGAGVYRWQPLSDTVTHVATIAFTPADDLLQYPGGVFEDLPHRRDVAQTAGGAQLVFATDSEVTSASGATYDNASSAAACDHQGAQRCTEVYRYDASSGQLTCVSCPAGAPAANAGLAGSVSLGGTSTLNQHGFAQARSITADGSTVFFETGEQLDAADVNSRYDVYQWQDGHVTLLSTGRSNADTSFVDASADGRDVFIVTRARLAANDADALADVYDVRVDGGFPVSPTPPGPCAGDACQGATPVAPPLQAAATVTFDGPGNVAEAPSRHTASKFAVRRSVRGRVATLRVRVPAAGVVTVSGAAVRRARRTASRAGTVVLRVALTPKARRALARRAHAAARQRERLRRAHRLTTRARRVLARKAVLRVRMRVAFTPHAGGRAARTLRVTFHHPGAARARHAVRRAADARRRAPVTATRGTGR